MVWVEIQSSGDMKLGKLLENSGAAGFTVASALRRWTHLFFGRHEIWHVDHSTISNSCNTHKTQAANLKFKLLDWCICIISNCTHRMQFWAYYLQL